MEYINRNEQNEIKKKTFLNFILILVIISIMLIMVFIVFDNSLSIFEIGNKVKEIELHKYHFSSLRDVIKPDKFKEEIQFIKLPNELEIIFINGTRNKKLKKNSIGLIVGSGSMNDDKVEGLAHFTEHILFLGSKKYSNVTFFNDFITTNDGHFNGFTDKDTTTFIYEINKEKFQESLDVFLNFFVNPLFKSEYLEKEIFAVNSEFEKNIHSDEKRFDRMFQSLGNPLHPFSKFSTGNKETLSANHLKLHKLRDLVIKYYHNHYIGRNIKIVVYGNYELNYIQTILINNMYKIHNHNQTSHKDVLLNNIKGKHGKSDKEIEIFTNKEKGKLIFFKSRYKTMKIFYFLKDFKNDLNNNPKQYFRILFSMRYKNSLFETLIHHRLIFNFRVEFKDKYTDLNAICFKFLLTEHGLKNSDLIIRLLSRYIQIVHKNIYNQEVFNHIKNVIAMKFKKKNSIKNPYKNMKKWTKNFYLFGKSNFISADNLLSNYNPEVYHDFIKNMTLYNSLIFIGSRSFKKFNETYLYKVLDTNHIHGINTNISLLHNNFSEIKFLNEKEKWYKTKYAEFKLDYDHIWHLFRRKLKNAELSFPSFMKNNARELKIIDNSLCKNQQGEKIKKKDCKKIYKNDRKTLIPNLIYKSDNASLRFHSELYHKLDRTHLKKSFVINMKIQPPFENLNLNQEKTIPLIKFLIIYLNFLQSEIKLDAEYSENVYNKHIEFRFLDNLRNPLKLFLWRNSKEKLKPEHYMIDGIYLNIKAKSPEVFEKSDVYSILNTLLNKKVEKKDFLYLKEELYRYIEFYKSSNPSHQALNWFYRLGFKYDINYFNMTHLIKDITLEHINEFKEKILSNFNTTSLAVGSINQEKAKVFVQNLETVFKNYSNNLSSDKSPTSKSTNATSTQSFMQAPYTKYGNHFVFQKNNLYKHSPDSTTLNIYFIGENSIYNIINTKIISNVAGNIFFSYLRIKHQLGYSVKNKLVNVDNNLMFYVHVQGSKKHPSYVLPYIDKVILKIKTKLNKIDEKSFEKIKENILKMITHVGSSLDTKNNYYWGYVLGQENIYNRKKVNEYLDHLTISDLNKFIDKLIDKRLSIQVANNNVKYEKVDKESIYINDLNYFRGITKFGFPHIHDKEIEQTVSKPPANDLIQKTFRKINRIK